MSGLVQERRIVAVHAQGACDMRTAAIARAWADARAHRIYAGTNEIMKELIGRTL